MEYTKGPWLIHPFVDEKYSIFNKTGTIHIADVIKEADAQLIIAAPDLLDFAIKFNAIIFSNTSKEIEALINLFKQLAQSAIKKADCS
jgi:hypothetical protein